MKNKKVIAITAISVAVVLVAIAGWYVFNQGWFEEEEESIVGVYYYSLRGSSATNYMEFNDYGINKIWFAPFYTCNMYRYEVFPDSNGNGEKEFRITSDNNNDWLLWDYTIDEQHDLTVTLIEASQYDDFYPGSELSLGYYGVPGSFIPS